MLVRMECTSHTDKYHKVEKKIEAIYHSQDFGLSIPDSVLDDWTDMSPADQRMAPS